MDFGRMVDVAVGLSLMFLMLSLFCTLINEVIVGHLFKLRSRRLKDGLVSLAGDCSAFWKVLGHPLIASAGPGPAAIAAREVLARAQAVLGAAEADFKAAKKKFDDAQRTASDPSVTAAARVALDAACKAMEDAQPGAGKAKVALDAAMAEAARKKAEGPSYLTGQAFAMAVLDTLNPDVKFSDSATCTAILEGIKALPPGRLRDAMRAVVNNTSADLQKIRDNVAQWFDDEMVRLEGAYKRRMQLVSAAIGLLLAVLLNVDTIQVTRTLWQEPKLAAAYAVQAAEWMKGQQGESVAKFIAAQDAVTKASAELAAANEAHEAAKAEAAAVVEEEKKKLDTAQDTLTSATAVRDALVPTVMGKLAGMKEVLTPLPIGWRDWAQVRCWATALNPFNPACKDGPDAGAALLRLCGWLLTAMALTLGAPFWFDMLNKVVNLRAAGAKPPTTAQSAGQAAK